MNHFIYHVEVVEEPDEAQVWPGGRSNYLSRSAAKHRVDVLSDHGIKAVVVRSNPVTWPELAVAE